MLLTLWLTAKIADSAKQREVRQAMQFVALELRDNLQVIQDYKWMYNASKKVRNWLGMSPRAFDSRYFETNEEKLETMIAELEKRYQ